MKSHIVGVGIGLLMASSLVFAQEPAVASAPVAAEKGAPAYYPLPASMNGVCIVRGVPAAAYTFIQNVKVAKGSYGSASVLVPELVGLAKAAGADAIVEYSGSQRFGFWPWQMIRPVVYGKAVKWNDPAKVDCAALAAVGEAGHQAEVKRRAAGQDAKAGKNAPATETPPAAEPHVTPAPAEPAK